MNVYTVTLWQGTQRRAALDERQYGRVWIETHVVVTTTPEAARQDVMAKINRMGLYAHGGATVRTIIEDVARPDAYYRPSAAEQANLTFNEAAWQAADQITAYKTAEDRVSPPDVILFVTVDTPYGPKAKVFRRGSGLAVKIGDRVVVKLRPNSEATMVAIVSAIGKLIEGQPDPELRPIEGILR